MEPECAICTARRLRRDVPRNLAFERMWTIDAAENARGVGRPFQLIQFAESRAAQHGLLRDVDQRDFGLEVLEELADARNYLVWWLLQLTRVRRADTSLTADVGAVVAQALSLVISAFEIVLRAHGLAERWRAIPLLEAA